MSANLPTRGSRRGQSTPPPPPPGAPSTGGSRAAGTGDDARGGLRTRAREAVERGREAVEQAGEQFQDARQRAEDEVRDRAGRAEGEVRDRAGRAEGEVRDRATGRAAERRADVSLGRDVTRTEISGQIGDRGGRAQAREASEPKQEWGSHREDPQLTALHLTLRNPRQLRQAVLLREVLGPPVSMRGDDEDVAGTR
jgi:hypothetical protein